MVTQRGRTKKSAAKIIPVLSATLAAPQGIAGALMGLPLVVILGLLARHISQDPSIASTATTPPLPQVYAAATP